MKTERESDLYPAVAKWAQKHFLCFKTEINKGLRYSKIDVIGVDDIGGVHLPRMRRGDSCHRPGKAQGLDFGFRTRRLNFRNAS
jgi:hypothetical protein